MEADQGESESGYEERTPVWPGKVGGRFVRRGLAAAGAACCAPTEELAASPVRRGKRATKGDGADQAQKLQFRRAFFFVLWL
jgi:hypothetical protein